MAFTLCVEPNCLRYVIAGRHGDRCVRHRGGSFYINTSPNQTARAFGYEADIRFGNGSIIKVGPPASTRGFTGLHWPSQPPHTSPGPFGVNFPAQFNMAKLLGIVLPNVEDGEEYEFDDALHVWLPRGEANNPWRGLASSFDNVLFPPRFWSMPPAIDPLPKLLPTPPWSQSLYDLLLMRYTNGLFGIYDEETPPKPLPPIVKEERTEEIVAWRAWYYHHVSPKYGFLESTSETYYWPPGEAAIGDVHKPSNGVHAYVSEERLQGSGVVECDEVYGTVSLWGTVFEHQDGVYRAEFAYPRHLWLSKEFEDENPGVTREEARANLVRLYGCEVELA